MRLSQSGSQRVDYEKAKHRALAYLLGRDRRELVKANAVAIVIWPDHQMTSQGAGAAASRILKRIEKEGLCKWDSDGHDWGYRLTNKGRDIAE